MKLVGQNLFVWVKELGEEMKRKKELKGKEGEEVGEELKGKKEMKAKKGGRMLEH